MDEDFRAKNIGMPNVFRCSVEGKKQLAEWQRKRADELAGRKRAALTGARISDDHGKTWKLYCLCDECVSQIEPPKLLKNEGAAGALKCDWCGALNEK